MIAVIEHFVTKHKPQQLIVVTDAGLLSHKNIEVFIQKQYQYILGARIKNESKVPIRQILTLGCRRDKVRHWKGNTAQNSL